MSSENRQCQNCKQTFTIEPADFDFYKKMDVPPPTFCPECRMVNRFLWRAGMTALFKAACALCQKSMLSMYEPELGYNVFCRECWYSDKWDPRDYGTTYDFSQTFFAQFEALQKRTPRPALFYVGNNPGSNFGNFYLHTSNAYLSSSIVESEEVLYSVSVDKSSDVVDSLFVKDCEYVYENVESARNHNSIFLVRSRDCIDSAFLFDSANCQNCFMSSNLRNRQYVFRNQQYTKGDYEAAIRVEMTGSYQKLVLLRKEFERVREAALHKFAHIIKAQDSTGDNLESVNRVRDSFDVYGSEDVRHSMRVVTGSKDLHDIFGAGQGAELLYLGMGTGYGSSRCIAITLTNAVHDTYYSELCYDAGPLWGCVGIRKKEYCILNKQYAKEEYEALIPQVKKHMDEMPFVDGRGITYGFGSFFPSAIVPFAYNRSMASDYWPLTKEQVNERGFRWRADDIRNYAITRKADELSDSEFDDGILSEVIGCEHTGSCNDQCSTAFRLVGTELAYYRRWNLPLPRLCPNCRHAERMKLRNPLRLWHRQCMCDYDIHQNTRQHEHHASGRCMNEFETSYAPERQEVVYCEACYNAEVV